jgi:D-tyrosyl-tRNA(Tyr) deacylase
MRIVLQRVKRASVRVQDKVVGEIEKGICLLVGIEKGDTEGDVRYFAQKVVELRIFPDAESKMNLSLLDIGGEVLAVSQFTLAGSVKKGRRPSFDRAEDAGTAKRLFDEFVKLIKKSRVKVETGIFGSMMEVHLVNDGPVTFILEGMRNR